MAKNHYYKVEEYEQLCQNAEPGERYEYAGGEIIRMEAYTTNAHNIVVGNTAFLLRSVFRPQGCRVYTENARLIIDSDEKHQRLADVMVTCSERDKQLVDSSHEPVLLVEVLSSNAFTDLGEKITCIKR